MTSSSGAAAAVGPLRPERDPAPGDALAVVGFVLASVVPPGAIACGHVALGRIRHTGEQGHGLALAAAVLGRVLTGVIASFVLLWSAALASIVLTRFGVLVAASRG